MFGWPRKKKVELHPDYPVVEGLHEMTANWSVVLPLPFNRRIEDGNLVLWRPGITAWIVVWGNDHNETVEARMQALKARRSPQAFGVQEFFQRDIGYCMYRVAEPADDQRVATFQCFAFAASGHVQMAVYFDSEDDLPTAEGLWRGLRPR